MTLVGKTLCVVSEPLRCENAMDERDTPDSWEESTRLTLRSLERQSWPMPPKIANLTKLDDRWRTAIWLGKSDHSGEHTIGMEKRVFLARSMRRKVEVKRWNERALKIVTGTSWHPFPGEVNLRFRYITGALIEEYGPFEDCGAFFGNSNQHTERCRATYGILCAGDDKSVEARARDGQRALADPGALGLESASAAAQTRAIDTEVMETEDVVTTIDEQLNGS